MSDPKWFREQSTVERFLRSAVPRSVLDVPVGTGRFLPLYDGLNATVIGIDVSTDMLDQAALRPVGGSEVTLQVGDVTALPLPDGSVDMAVCVRLLNLVPFDVVSQALGELARVSCSHVIVGIRLREPLRVSSIIRLPSARREAIFRLRGYARALRKGGRKVTPHPARRLRAALEDVGLRPVHCDVIDRWPDGSVYYMYLAEKVEHGHVPKTLTGPSTQPLEGRKM